MLLITPDVQEVYDWFYATHQLTMTLAGVQWQRNALPAAGAVGDQDNELLEALEYLRNTMNGIIVSEMKPKERKQTNG